MLESDSPRGETFGKFPLSQQQSGGGRYSGDRDDLKRPHGRGKVEHTITRKSVNIEGQSDVSTDEESRRTIVVIEGQWNHGELDGAASFSVNGRVVYDGLWRHGWMALHSAMDVQDVSERGNRSDCSIGSMSIRDLEAMWAHCSDCCLPANAAANKNKGREGVKSLAERASDRCHGLPVVTYPGGPTDLASYVRLVSVWFLCGTIFVLIMGY